jgi:hypothetical protein
VSSCRWLLGSLGRDWGVPRLLGRALAEDRRDAPGLVVSHGLRPAAVGILVGIAGAFGSTRFVSTLRYNVAPSDPVSVGLVAAFLIVAAAVASDVPAGRAVVDPIIVLRNE